MRLTLNTIDKKKYTVVSNFSDDISEGTQLQQVLTTFKASGYIKDVDGKVILYHSVISVDIVK